MRLYSSRVAPNPRRVRIYLAEKGIAVEIVEVDLLAGEHRSPEFLEKNPLGLVPVLELEDGRTLTESLAICEYLEEMHPTPPLIGTDPWQRAMVREAERIAELGLLSSAATVFQHSHPFFASRIKQIPEVAEAGRKRFAHILGLADAVLGRREWLGGTAFSIADITALVAIDFGAFAGCAVDPELANVCRWLAAVRARPSAKA